MKIKKSSESNTFNGILLHFNSPFSIFYEQMLYFHFNQLNFHFYSRCKTSYFYFLQSLRTVYSFKSLVL